MTLFAFLDNIVKTKGLAVEQEGPTRQRVLNDVREMSLFKARYY